jgi:hypothetical protein
MSNPSTPALSVAEVIAELVAAASARRPELASRLARAAQIALTDSAIHAGSAGVAVHCLADWAVVYHVNGARCTCPDSQYRAVLCKHALAVGLLSVATRQRHAQQRARDFGERWELTEAGELALSALA